MYQSIPAQNTNRSKRNILLIRCFSPYTFLLLSISLLSLSLSHAPRLLAPLQIYGDEYRNGNGDDEKKRKTITANGNSFQLCDSPNIKWNVKENTTTGVRRWEKKLFKIAVDVHTCTVWMLYLTWMYYEWIALSGITCKIDFRFILCVCVFFVLALTGLVVSASQHI